jgi:hypothetical protein
MLTCRKNDRKERTGPIQERSFAADRLGHFKIRWIELENIEKRTIIQIFVDGVWLTRYFLPTRPGGKCRQAHR